MTVQIMSREEFEVAHREECRRFFEILAEVSKTWRGPRLSDDHRRDDQAGLAARILSDERVTLQERIKSGYLRVAGFDR